MTNAYNNHLSRLGLNESDIPMVETALDFIKVDMKALGLDYSKQADIDKYIDIFNKEHKTYFSGTIEQLARFADAFNYWLDPKTETQSGVYKREINGMSSEVPIIFINKGQIQRIPQIKSKLIGDNEVKPVKSHEVTHYPELFILTTNVVCHEAGG